MDILNITFNVEKAILADWRAFMGKVFIPYSHVQEKFAGHNFYHVLVEDPLTETYSFQLIAKDEATIDSYLSEIFPALRREMVQAFGEKVMLFDTKLREEKI